MSRVPLHLSLILPVKDGEFRLAEMLEEVDDFVRGYGRSCEVIAVDDGSTDATPQILADFARDHDYLKVITHAQNRGKGAALKTATAFSLGEHVVTVDSDATYKLDSIADFVAALESGSDAAIGNRRDQRTKFVLHPRDFAYVGRRHAMGWVFGFMARMIAGLRVKDCQAGFKAYRGDVARKLFPEVDANRFAFDVEILALLQVYGHPIAEVPVVYVYRDQPTTTKLFRDGFRMIKRLFRVRMKVRRVRRSGSFVDHTRGDYQRLARTQGHPVQRFWHAKKWPLVQHYLDFDGAHRVLDVGAGSSEITDQILSFGSFTCATDFSTSPLQYRSETAENGSSRSVCLVGADIRALPFRDGSFDRVVVLEVIEHVPRDGIDTYFGELRRILAPGGELLVTTPNYRSTWPVLEWLVDHFGGAAEMGGKQHITHFHPRMLHDSLEANGFRVKRRGSVYHFSPFLAPLAPRFAERVFRWEMQRGGNVGPIIFSVAEAAAR